MQNQCKPMQNRCKPMQTQCNTNAYPWIYPRIYPWILVKKKTFLIGFLQVFIYGFRDRFFYMFFTVVFTGLPAPFFYRFFWEGGRESGRASGLHLNQSQSGPKGPEWPQTGFLQVLYRFFTGFSAGAGEGTGFEIFGRSGPTRRRPRHPTVFSQVLQVLSPFLLPVCYDRFFHGPGLQNPLKKNL